MTKVYSIQIYAAMETVIFAKYTSVHCLVMEVSFYFTQKFMSVKHFIDYYIRLLRSAFIDFKQGAPQECLHSLNVNKCKSIFKNLMRLFVFKAICEEFSRINHKLMDTGCH